MFFLISKKKKNKFAREERFLSFFADSTKTT